MTLKQLDKIARLNPVPIQTGRGTDYVIQISPNDRDELVALARPSLSAPAAKPVPSGEV